MPSSGNTHDANWVIFTTEIWDNFILSVKLVANAYLQTKGSSQDLPGESTGEKMDGGGPLPL